MPEPIDSKKSRMNTLKISTRLTLPIAVLSSLLVAGVGLYGMSKSDDALDTVYKDRAMPLAQLGEMQYLIAALVEEMSAAARSMQTQAQDLVQAVAVFHLGGGEDAAGPRPSPRQKRVGWGPSSSPAVVRSTQITH